MLNDVERAEVKNDVVILAGGFGTRLQEVIGKERPKPMALIGEKPLLEHQIQECKKYGLTNILILLHHLPDVIVDYFSDGKKFGVSIQYAIEDSPRGTAGAIADNLDFLNDVFLVIYGDTVFDVDLSAFWSEKSPQDDVLTFCHPNAHPFDSDLLEVNESGFVTGVFRPQRTGRDLYSNLVNAALYVCSRRVFAEFVPATGRFDISSELFPLLIQRGGLVKAYKSVEYIKDMGTPDRYAKINREVKAGVPARLSRRNKRLAVFLDRDGVINELDGYITSMNQFRLKPGVCAAIKKLNDCGVLAIVVTNQPQIARGELDYPGLQKIHQKMEVELGREGAFVDGVYFCPHHPDKGFTGEVESLKIACNCRKPSPGMLFDAAADFDIALTESWLVGDHARDIAAGLRAGVKTCYVGSSSKSVVSDVVSENLPEAVQTILDSMDQEREVLL